MRSYLAKQFKPTKIFSNLAAVLIITLAFLFDTSTFAQTIPLSKVDLSLTPGSGGFIVDRTFNIDIAIDGKTNKVSAADLEIDFDPEFLQLQVVTPGNYLPAVLTPAKIDNTNGKATLILGASPGNLPTGQGKLASLQFKAQKETTVPTKIIINPSSAVVVIGENSNFIGQLQDSNVTVSPDIVVLKTAAFELITQQSSYKIGEEFGVTLKANSSLEEANLFSALINFDPSLFEITKIDTQGSFVTQWVNSSFDNSLGTAKIIGGVPSPGFKTPDLSSDMATIFFKAKKVSSGLIDFDNQSAIYRNSDNNDILQTKTPLILQIVSPSPTPSLNPTPTPTITPIPTASPSSAPTTLPCVITAASWSTNGPVTQGKFVAINITGSGDCNGKQVNVTVKEDDGILGTQEVSKNPIAATFNGTNAITNWFTEYQEDGIFGVWDPPEYFFNAQINGDSKSIKSINRLTVTKLLVGQSIKGDGDNDGVINLKDLSMLFSFWNKNNNFPFNLDINDDGVINSFDFSGILKLLNLNKII